MTRSRRATARPVPRPPGGALARVPALTVAGATLIATLVGAAPFARAADGFGDAPEPLPVTEAFAPRVATAGRDGVTVEWDIAEGHYLYRDKTRVELGGALADAASLGPLAFSPAETVSDEFFGDSAVWRDRGSASAPLLDAAPGGAEGTLEVSFQGCADIGLCYPPTTVSLAASVPAAPPPTDPLPVDPLPVDPLPAGTLASASPFGAAPAPSGRGALDALFGADAAPGAGPELLRPEEAFVPLLARTATDALEVRWRIEPGYYLYEHRFGFEVLDADGGAVAAPVAGVSIPGGVDETDEFFGEVTTFHDEAVATVALGPGLVAGEGATLRAAYQGCAKIGVCFPPSTIDLPFVATAAAGDGPVVASAAPPGTALASADGGSPGGAGGAAGTPATPALVSEQDRLSGLLANASLWWSALTFYGLGLLLAFTPCVLPMVPILSSLVVGRAGDGEASGGAGRAFRLSLVYVLVMATTYALAGTLVAVSGANVQVWLQQPWVLGAFAALFVALALAMFGLFELEVPRFLQARLAAASNRQAGGSYRGVIAMGLLSTLIVGPCVTAPLAGALIFIADTGDAVVGATALFALGLGMGTPLLLIGTSAGSLLPRAGAWMVRVRQGFGVLLLGLAIWMLSRFVPETLTVALAGTLVLATGIWLGATDRIDADTGGARRAGKGLGLAVSLYGAALVLGALGGSESLVRPLAVFGGAERGGGAEERGLAFSRVASVEELDRVVAGASADGRHVMLDFYADWCVSCKEMEAYTFTDERVRALLDGVVLVQADVTENDAADKALLDRFDLFAPPAIVFYDPAGREVPGARVVGFVPAGRFGAHLERVLAPNVAGGA